MATSYTLATLKAAMVEIIEDQGTDFAAKENGIIQRAEDRLLMDLDLEIFDATDDLTFSSGSRYATLPSNCIKPRTLYYTDANSKIAFLEQRTKEYIFDYWPGTGTSATVKYWAPYSTTQVMVGPTPGASPATGKCVFIKRPASLVTDTAGSWLSLNVGSLLLQACLIEAYEVLRKMEARNTKLTEYVQVRLPQAKNELRHITRQDYAPIAATPTPKQEK